MPIDYKKYPKNWHEISDRIRFVRAGGKCEWCGAPHGEIIVRDPKDPSKFRVVDGMEIDAAVLDDERLTKVVLTTAHLGRPRFNCCDCGKVHQRPCPPEDENFCQCRAEEIKYYEGDKSDLHDVREENLAALCQRCHLNFDLKERLESRLASRVDAEKADGQIFMEDA